MEDKPTPTPAVNAPATWPSLRFAMELNGMAQGALVVFSAMTLDGGVSLRVSLQATAAYWIMVAWLAWRRGNVLDAMDTALVRIGAFLWLAVAVAVEMVARSNA